jgi:4-amino-4-deoxy-L-arabinose transferase-like glycosyltransferase
MPKIPFWIFIILAILLFLGARIDTMDIDASQYAEMSREMLTQHHYLQLYDRGSDYLDKPPFLFWVSSFSMWLFGISNFGYKLPSILFALLAIYATYRLARLLYDDATGRMAALILGTSQGMFLMTNDIRTDTILMSWVITAIWLLKEWDLNKKIVWLLGGAAAIAFGMMTKGPVALLVPVFCFASDWALKREWRKFVNPQLILALLLIGVLLIPMSIGLYQQFDLHPEKLVDGKHGVSGLKFFYWTQSFGRVTGESNWSNGAGFEFLLMNMLWSFLPWIFLFLAALILSVREVIIQRVHLSARQEWVSTGGFILSYISLAASHYQLPHYIFVVFPLAAIMTAKLFKDLLEGSYPKLHGIMRPVQMIVGFLLLVAALLTFAVVFKGSLVNYFAWTAGLLYWLFLVVRKCHTKTFWAGAAAIMIANIFMSNHFYRRLLDFQLGSSLGKYISQHKAPSGSLSSYRVEDPLNALHFYAGQVIPRNDSLNNLRKGDWLITMETGLDSLRAKGFDLKLIRKQHFFKVSELTPQFLNPATRAQSLKTACLIELQ